MYFDANAPDFKRAAITCDVAIVGAGPAGITLARSLRESSLRVCVLESGGLDSSPAAQQLSDGSVRTPSPAVSPEYISQHSQRIFGGTGSVWGGYCRPLDKMDFEQRGLPFLHQWPISLETLAPYYGWEALAGKHDRVPVPGSALEIKYYEKVVYPFHQVHRNEFREDTNIEVILNATVRDIILHSSGHVAHLNVVNTGTAEARSTKDLQVNAQVYVLACGGVGNVKLLLNANGVAKNGIGNDKDLVGRYFMDHPHFQFYDTPALLWLGDKEAPWLYRDERYKPAFYFSEERIRENKLLNFCAMLSTEFDDQSQFAGNKLYRPNFAALSEKPGAFYSLAFRCEQSPQRDSRVTLLPEKDALGQRRVHLDWQLSDEDKNSLLKNIHQLAEELGSASLGRMRPMLDSHDVWQTMVGGGHLMGTTRMSHNSEEGVVNPDCGLHNVGNLYLAGSSVFPTSGVSNPTLTLMALARRLAVHLKDKLGRG